ncbi:hypothetical protein BU25DRAFT_482541 [Macroventuria anomochaeta]|uniref:Uncharacterized protein n=1 Tax=Macroventuria anomochaeta TaxID=301207 RepID=A0ACB6RIT8_9PLEO|nr:uncharacterized protein BU25DRAFT_482541 [Macroventuria anomochaeta]KAF2621602.1 hypothetical protein BU25DRAFT_482541 [Macroventuria anomochaeta]
MAATDAFTGLPDLIRQLNVSSKKIREDSGNRHEPEATQMQLVRLEEMPVVTKPRKEQRCRKPTNTAQFRNELMQRTQKHAGVTELRNHFYNAVQDYFAEMDLHFGRTCRIIVRAFTHLTAVSRDASNTLPFFTVCYSSADPFFDFTIVLNSETVGAKITVTFVAATKDQSCKHIFATAWRPPAYIRMLNTADEKTTIIEGSSMQLEFDQVPLPVPFTAFPLIFKIQRATTLAPCTTTRDAAIHLEPSSPGGGIGDQGRVDGLLPNSKNAITGHIPINVPQRLPTGKQTAVPLAPSREQVSKGDKCLCDNTELNKEATKVLRYSTEWNPCGPNFRITDCIYGHVCQNWKCVGSENANCTMKCFIMSILQSSNGSRQGSSTHPSRRRLRSRERVVKQMDALVRSLRLQHADALYLSSGVTRQHNNVLRPSSNLL